MTLRTHPESPTELYASAEAARQRFVRARDVERAEHRALMERADRVLEKRR